MKPQSVALEIVPWDVTAFSPEHEAFEERDCPRCSTPLSIHQPEPMTPTRLLATCSCCEAWYYIDVAPDGSAALMIHLPRAIASWSPAPASWERVPVEFPGSTQPSTGVA